MGDAAHGIAIPTLPTHFSWPIDQSIARRRQLRAPLPLLLRALRPGGAAGAALHLATAEARQPAPGRWAQHGNLRRKFVFFFFGF